MNEKVPMHQSVDVWPASFQNDDTINARLNNIHKMLIALQPKYPLHFVVYPILEANLSTPSNFLIRLKKKR